MEVGGTGQPPLSVVLSYLGLQSPSSPGYKEREGLGLLTSKTACVLKPVHLFLTEAVTEEMRLLSTHYHAFGIH